MFHPGRRSVSGRGKACRRPLSRLPRLEILEGRTLPSFGPPVLVAEIDPNPAAIATGDFDGDRTPDLVIGYLKGDHCTILLGNGDGTFRDGGSFLCGFDAAKLLVGDFNGDGILDIARIGVNSDTGSVLLGNGDGTFQKPRDFATGITFGPADLQQGDFHGDGIPDLLVTQGFFSRAQVNLLRGNGDGTFQAPRTILNQEGSVSQSVALGDFNGDGHLGIAATEVTPSGESQVNVLLGNGDGTFRPPVAYATHGGNSAEQSVVAADFSGDGIIDLAVKSLFGVDVLRGNGDGTFQPAVFYPSNVGRGLQVADINGDGIPDLIAGPSAGGPGVFWLGNGDGTFQPAESYMAGSESRSTGFVVADFQGNGFPDLAFVSQDFGMGHGQVFILNNQADWPAQSPLRPVHPQIPAVGAGGPMVTAGALTATNEQFPVQRGEQDGSCRISRPGTDYLEHQASRTAPSKHVRLQLQSRAIDSVFTRGTDAWDSLVSAPP
jgi:hypothetical protein